MIPVGRSSPSDSPADPHPPAQHEAEGGSARLVEAGLPRLWILGCALPIAVALVGLVAALGWWTLNSFSARPDRVWAANFDGVAGDGHHLRGGGISWLGSDAWLRFDSSVEPPVRDRERWRPADPKAAVDFFLGFCPDDRASLDDRSNLVALVRSDPTKGISNGKWLLWNRRTGAAFFRTWAHS